MLNFQGRFSDRNSDNLYYGETVSPHDYVNAYVGLRRMMTQLARMSGHGQYDSPYFGMGGPRSEDYHDQHQHHRCRRPQSAPCGVEPEDYEYFRGCSRMNSRCHDKFTNQSHRGESGSNSMATPSEQDAPTHERMRHFSKRSHKQKMRDNFRRLTRCLSGDEEETEKNTKLNNSEKDYPNAIEGNLPKQHNFKVDAKDLRSNIIRMKQGQTDSKKSTTQKAIHRETQCVENTFTDSILKMISGDTKPGPRTSEPKSRRSDESTAEYDQALPVMPEAAESIGNASKQIKRQETVVSQPYDHMAFKQQASRKPALGQIAESPSPTGDRYPPKQPKPNIKPPFVLRRQPPALPEDCPASTSGASSGEVPVLVTVENEEVVNRILPTESSDHGSSSRSSKETFSSNDSTEQPSYL